MIHIGTIHGGPETSDSPFAAIDREVTLRISKTQRGVLNQDEGSINIVWHVHGSLLKPEHKGLRTGKFSKKERMLMIQVAVPREQVYAEHPERFIFKSIRQSIEIAKTVFRSAKIPFAADEHLNFLDGIERTWREDHGCHTDQL